MNLTLVTVPPEVHSGETPYREQSEMDPSKFNSLVEEFPFLTDVITQSKGMGGWNDYRALVNFKVARMNVDLLKNGPFRDEDRDFGDSGLELYAVWNGRATPLRVKSYFTDDEYFEREYENAASSSWDHFMDTEPPPWTPPEMYEEVCRRRQQAFEIRETINQANEQRFGLRDEWRVAFALQGNESIIVRVDYWSGSIEEPDPEDEWEHIYRNCFENTVTVFKSPQSCTLRQLIDRALDEHQVPMDDKPISGYEDALRYLRNRPGVVAPVAERVNTQDSTTTVTSRHPEKVTDWP